MVRATSRVAATSPARNRSRNPSSFLLGDEAERLASATVGPVLVVRDVAGEPAEVDETDEADGPDGI